MNSRSVDTPVWLPPFLVLAAVIVLEIAGIGGVVAALRALTGGVYDIIADFAPALAGNALERPLFVAQAELLYLAAAGIGIVFLLARSDVVWAGYLTIWSAAAVSLFSLWMAFQLRIFFDAAYLSAVFAAVFVPGFVLHRAAASAEKSRFRHSLMQRFSPQVVAAVARDPQLLGLAGLTREMSFLVCGVANFSGISESFAADPAGLCQLTQRFTTPLAKAVLDRQGTVGRVMPGGLNAFFNAPLDDPEHAVHACACALRMTDEMKKTSRDIEQGFDADGLPVGPVEISVGIDTGTAIAGEFGTDTRREYAATGRAAEDAAALQRLSAKYGAAILVGARTREAAEDKFAFLEVDLLGLGPEGEPKPVFALLGNLLIRASPKFRALQTYHENILQAYRAREWEKARELIEQCSKLSGASLALYALYLARIAYYEANPPGDGWDGVFRPPQA